jgi:Skp family chaperone for outer membrane proteins
MTMPRLLLALAALVALTLPTVQAVEATPKGSTAPKIAVLRLEDVLRQSKSYLAGMEGWKKQQAEAQAAITAIDEQLKRLDGQLQVLKPESENFGKFQEELEVLKLKKKVGYDRARAELERRQVALVKDAFKQMRQALAAFCQERGIMLVHLAPDPDLGAPTFNEVQLELGLKSVLYFDSSLDVTDAFITYLNAGDKPADKPAAPAADVKTAP